MVSIKSNPPRVVSVTTTCARARAGPVHEYPARSKLSFSARYWTLIERSKIRNDIIAAHILARVRERGPVSPVSRNLRRLIETTSRARAQIYIIILIERVNGAYIIARIAFRIARVHLALNPIHE